MGQDNLKMENLRFGVRRLFLVCFAQGFGCRVFG